MATLVLTAVGSLFGPVGAAVGALAGQAIDAQIFKSAGRQGSRLSDLRVQTSSFGTQIPQLFGRMRVAGTVIWATDLIEGTETNSAGKGQPEVTTYNYSASFAVALSSRPIVRVGRIWADGNLLRGAEGDFKSGLGGFRVYDGTGDQAVDPLIASDRGIDAAPAHRGLAYALFEGLQLADFGNRIPSLTFELIADEAPVAVSAALAMLGGVAAQFAGEGEPVLAGYAASGDSAGDALQPVLDGYDLSVRADGDVLTLTTGAPVGPMLSGDADLRATGGTTLAAREVERQPVEAVPRRLSVRHYDPARDYQAGVQSAERQGAGQGEAQVDLPVTLDSAGARQRAADLLQRHVLGRRTVSLSRGWDALVLAPGGLVSLDDHAGVWRIEALEWEKMAVRLSLKGVPGQGARLPATADGGSGVRQPDRPVGPTHVALVETPQLFDTAVSQPQLFVAACGEGSGWRGAAILSREETGSYAPLGSIRRRAVLGETLGALSPGPSRLFDTTTSVEVQLHDPDAILAPASDAALLSGANACMIGEELLQFGHVSQSGIGRYRLSRLLRGRRGTEHGIAGHIAGETVLLLEADRLLALTGTHGAPGRSLAVVAQGPGDATPAEAERTVDGRAMLPLSPVHLRVEGGAGSGVTLRWIRRSRIGWAWLDGVDAPLGEEAEVYVVSVLTGDRSLRAASVTEPIWTYPPDAIAADLLSVAGTPLTLSVRQSGTFGFGTAASLTLPF